MENPTTMSDKALQYLIENTDFKHDFYVIFGQDEAARILQSYADQHLKDVLEEAFKEWAENHEPYKAELFNNGVAWLLNHLKQKQ